MITCREIAFILTDGVQALTVRVSVAEVLSNGLVALVSVIIGLKVPRVASAAAAAVMMVYTTPRSVEKLGSKPRL